MIPLALSGSLPHGIVFAVMSGHEENDIPYIPILQRKNVDAEEKAVLRFSESVKKYKVKPETVKVKSKTVNEAVQNDY